MTCTEQFDDRFAGRRTFCTRRRGAAAKRIHRESGRSMEKDELRAIAREKLLSDCEGPRRQFLLRGSPPTPKAAADEILLGHRHHLFGGTGLAAMHGMNSPIEVHALHHRQAVSKAVDGDARAVF